jgi:hypothetical protein
MTNLQVGHTEMDGDDTEHACTDGNDGHGAYSNNDIGIDPEDSNNNVYSPTNYAQVTQYLLSLIS